MTSAPEILLRTRRFDVERISYRRGEGQVFQREVVRHPGAATVLPVIDDDRILLIRNHRPAVDESLIELPAGTLEPGEEPAATAARELAEETGYSAGRLIQLTAFYLSPGILDERMFLFLATDLSAGEPHREAVEQIQNLVVRRDEALAMIHDGRIHDAKTITGLLWYERWAATSSGGRAPIQRGGS